MITDNNFMSKYFITICILLAILLFIYYNNYYRCDNYVCKDSEQLICKWNLEDEISKFTLRQDGMIKSN